MVRRSNAHSKYGLKVRMDIVDIHCYYDNGSSSLFHSSAEEMIYIQMDTTQISFYLTSSVEISFLNL